MKPVSTTSLLAGATLIALAMCSCGASSPPPGSQPSGAGARPAYCGGASGTVTWYNPNDQASQMMSVAMPFEKACGIQVNVVSLNGSVQVWQRFSQEQAAGVHKVDVVTLSSYADVLLAENLGYVSKIPATITKNYSPAFKDPDDYWFSTRLIDNEIVINTNEVSNSDAPKSWADLLQPKWRGKISVLDPTQSGQYSDDWQIAHAPGLGINFFKRLGKQKLGIYVDAGQALNATIEGEYPITINAADAAWPQIEKGAPLKVIIPKEGLGFNQDENLLSRNAPNARAAKAFLAYMASPGAGEIFSKETLDYSPATSLAFPKGMPAKSKVKFLSVNLAQEAAQQATLAPLLLQYLRGKG